LGQKPLFRFAKVPMIEIDFVDLNFDPLPEIWNDKSQEIS
jgi:hypothetical protein